MVILRANTNRKPIAIDLGVESKRPTRVRIVAFDKHKKGAIYMDREKNLNGKQDFTISLPQSPKELTIKVIGDVRVYKFKKKKLMQYAPCLKAKVKPFIKFAKEFTENVLASEVSACMFVPRLLTDNI